MRRDSTYDDTDKAALHKALLALHRCPRCRKKLVAVRMHNDVWACNECVETWYVPKESVTRRS